VVIGSSNSSNTVALERLARDSGCDQVFRVNAAEELPRDADGSLSLHGTVGVTAGASAPEELVDAVLDALAPTGGVEEVRITDEDEYFPPPRNLRDLITAIDRLASLGLGGPGSTSTTTTDRTVPASSALGALR
jgi:4-hydroxy-3-methylbut-2-enyl diphosphate reductase